MEKLTLQKQEGIFTFLTTSMPFLKHGEANTSNIYLIAQETVLNNGDIIHTKIQIVRSKIN